MYCCCCSITKTCLNLWPVDCSRPGLPVLHYLPKFAQTHMHWIDDATQPSHPLFPLLLLPSIYLSIRIFPMNWFFPSGGQSIGASTSVSALPKNIQSWFSLGKIGLIYFLSNDLFDAQPSLWSNSHNSIVHDYWKNYSFDYMHVCPQSDVSAF